MLTVDDLSVSYGLHRALAGVSLFVSPGEIVVILGANGAGKSTLLRAVAGICEGRADGRIELGGKDLLSRKSDEIVEAGIAFVPQGRGIFADLTVWENLMLGAYSKRGRRGKDKNLDRVLRLFPKLVERKNQVASTMSGGEQQMVAIGRAMMANPEILMLDEPSLGLSPILCTELFNSFSHIRKTGMGILLVEQNAKKSLAIADRGYLIENGEITGENSAEALLHDSAVQAAYLGGVDLQSHAVSTCNHMKRKGKETMNEGQTIIVTGVASGIGAQTAKLLKSQGATVIGVDRNETDNCDSFFKADLSDPQSIDGLVESLPAGANGLANIAGLPPTAAAELVLKVNLLGLRQFTETIVPRLADGASIVNLASLAGFGWPSALDQAKSALALSLDGDVASFCKANDLDAPGGRSYFLSKEALIIWTMKNRWTWRDRGIRMNTVSPGPVDTPILPDFLATLGKRAEEDMRVMDRPGKPEDVAPVVAFLLSDHSGWIRGTNIASDGGMSSHILCEMHTL